mmetsp:Transcript_10013/g.19211  ORF Transcript_10013/g.19211 Transcript_10013/m.19211 type:complete len:96 (-) Transcript_10013:37-324(-)
MDAFVLLVPLLQALYVLADGESYPYKKWESSGGVEMGTHMALAVPPQLLYIIMLGMVSFIGYLAYRLINMENEKKKKKEERKSKKKSSKSKKKKN